MVFDNWVVSGCVKLRMLDNKTSIFEVVGNIPDDWNWQLLYTCNDNLNIVDMVYDGNSLSVLLTKEMLPMEGTYHFQIKATKGELIKHTNIVKSYVNKSLSGDVQWPVVPSEFTDIENAVKGYAESAKESAEKAEDAAVHSPVIGSNGNWWVWNFDTSEYIDTGISASGGGSADISLNLSGALVGQIIKVEEIDQNGKPTKWKAVNESVSSVNNKTGNIKLDAKGVGALPNVPVTISDNGKVMKVVNGVWGKGDVDSTAIDLGVTGAAVGDIIKVAAVDADGKPSAWEAAELASGDDSGGWFLIGTYVVPEVDDGATSISFTKDANGNDFQVREVMACFNGTIKEDVQPSSYIYVNLFDAAGKIGQFPLTRNATGAAGTSYICNAQIGLFGGIKKIGAIGGKTDSTVSFTCEASPIENAVKVTLSAFNNSTKTWAATPFAAGGKITIYGRT